MSWEAAFVEIVSGRRQDWRARSARLGLACLEPLYSIGSSLKNALFERGFKRSDSAGVPVVSVGNLTTGGTGKTPVVAAVVQSLTHLGLKPGIASRGYRSLDAGGNDEKRVLDLLCPGVPHVQDRDRVHAAHELAALGASVVVLDDGFQHRRLKRDLDILLVDATNPWGYGHQLPRGLLRESRRGLGRAGMIVITRSDLISTAEREHLLAEIKAQARAPVVTSRFLPVGLRDRAGSIHLCDEWKGRRVVAFCGIGNPGAFRATLERTGLVPHSHAVKAFADHHHYTAEDLSGLISEAEATHSAALVCTLKDLVKLPALETSIPVLAIDIGFDVIDGMPQWDQCSQE